MNQIARGGYSLTPPEGGTTGVPLASGIRGQTPPSSSTLPGRFEPPTPHPCKKSLSKNSADQWKGNATPLLLIC